MCHEWWSRRQMRRQDRFDEELRYLLDEHERAEPPTPIVEHEPAEELAEPERLETEAGTRA